MSIATAALVPLERRLPKVINARTHGIIDYCQVAFFFGMAIACRKRNSRAAVAALATGAFILTESLLTDYPLGAAKILPFETHGKLDSALAASSVMVPRILGFEDTPEAAVFKAGAIVEGAIVGMTDWKSGQTGNTETVVGPHDTEW